LPSNLSVGQLLERWLDHITPSREPGTIRGYATHIRAIDEQIGAVKLAELTALQLDKAYAAWLRMGLSPNTVHHRHAILRTALRQAVKWGLVPRAATDNASPPPLRSKPIAAVPADDVVQLYEAAGEDQPTLALAIYLAAATGLRRGELCALQWSDIDESGVLHVHAAAKHGLEGRQVEIRGTKTHQDRRVALGETALAVMVVYRADLVQAAGRVGLEVPVDAFILSLDPLGTVPMKPDSLGQAFRRIARRLGMEIRFHDLRHFTATQLTVFSDMAIVPLPPAILPALWTRACPIGEAAMFSGTAFRRQPADYSWHYRANPWPSPTQARWRGARRAPGL
jgi:integrase